MFDRIRHFYVAYQSQLTDLLTGMMLVIAVALLLNRGLFGLETGEGWTVSYGNF